MTEAVTSKTYADFVLPPSLVSRVDIALLVSEFETLDNELTATAVRAKSGVQQTVPAVSEILKEFVTQNKLKVDDSRERTELIKQLRLLKDKVPTIHMTFAVTADRQSLEELAAWLRKSIHPQVVIAVGLQPALIAGVYLRTANQVKDLSLRAMLQQGHGNLVKELGALRG